MDGELRQLLLPVRAAGHQRRGRGGGPARGDGARRGLGAARRRPGRAGAGGRRRPRPVVRRVVPLPARGRGRALGPGVAAGGRLRAAIDEGGSRRRAVEATAEDPINSSLCYGFVAEMVGVRIDPETLHVTLDRVSTVHDAGTVLDPVLIEGQVLGALVHGLGGAVYEEFRYSPSGQPTSATFMDYLCPTIAETAFQLTTDHISTPSPLTPLGAKGCGEGSSMSLPVAFANAVADALAPAGVTIDSLPLHGNVVHQLLRRESHATHRRRDPPGAEPRRPRRQPQPQPRPLQHHHDGDPPGDGGWSPRSTATRRPSRDPRRGGALLLRRRHRGLHGGRRIDWTDLGRDVTAAARSPKPVVMVVDGYCFGVGLEVALTGDIRLATPAAVSRCRK